MEIVRKLPDPESRRTTSIERSKIVLAVALELAAKELVVRLLDHEKREKMANKELADFIDKSAKYVLPRDIRIRVADPEVLQAIAAVTAEMLPEGEFQTWLTRVSISLEGTAIAKNMATTGMSAQEVMEEVQNG